MISIVVPAYNEEEVIETFLTHMKKRLVLKEDYELLIVNDGSHDNTKKIVERCMRTYPSVRLVNHEVNKGLGAALRTGFQEAKGRIIICMDSDLTHPPELIPRMVENINGADVVYASRYVTGGGMKNVPGWRVALSVLANNFFRFVLWLPVKDTTSGFRAYKSDIIKKIKIERVGFAVQLEITTKLAKMKAHCKEIPLLLANREVGSSKFNFTKMIPRYARNIIELWYLRWFG